MRIDVQFDSNLERFFATLVALLVFAAIFLAGNVVAPSNAHAEWDSEGSFGDSYYLRSMSESLDRSSDIFYDISSTLDALESKLSF
jgi:hypothetical protein